jgi:hypothetical protein
MLPSAPQVAALDGEPLPDKAVHCVAEGIWAVGFMLRGSGTLQVRFA